MALCDILRQSMKHATPIILLFLVAFPVSAETVIIDTETQIASLLQQLVVLYAILIQMLQELNQQNSSIGSVQVAPEPLPSPSPLPKSITPLIEEMPKKVKWECVSPIGRELKSFKDYDELVRNFLRHQQRRTDEKGSFIVVDGENTIHYICSPVK